MSAGAMDHVDLIVAQWQRERPDLDVSPQAVIGRLHRLGELLARELDVVFAAHGLGPGEFDVLAALRRAGRPFELLVGQLADHTMVASGAATKRIDRLERAGLVTRRPGSDRRQRVVALTAEGLRVADAALEDHMRNEHRLLAGLSTPERAQLADLLRAFLLAMGDAAPGDVAPGDVAPGERRTARSTGPKAPGTAG